MATTHKILGQVAPAATTETDLYTVPASTEVIVSRIIITERGGGTPTVRVSVSANGAATATKDYLIYDKALVANGYIEIMGGITLDASDKIRVYASDANCTFQVYGVEIS